MNNLSFIDEKLDALEKQGLRREIKTVITAPGPWIELANGKRVLQFASNNYLGLANHPELINASKSALIKFGTGSTGSRLLSGTTELHVQLEKTIADFEGTGGDAIYFSSGYAANVGVISSLISKQDAVYSDELNHASIIDGINLSGADKFIYQHNDVHHLEKLVLENRNKYTRNFIITDSVFSMDGDIAPLHEIGLLAQKYDCLTIVDEAHGTGVFGNNSTGVIEELNVGHYFPIRTGTCSKALGVEGGFCIGPKNLIEYLRNESRSFVFSTSPSPMVIGAIVKSIELIKSGNWRKERLWHNAKLLHSTLKKNPKLELNEFKSPIIIIYFNSIEEALQIADKLLHECHIWAPVIRPPSVKQPRIRLTPISTHSEEDINYVIKAFNYLTQYITVKPLELKVS